MKRLLACTGVKMFDFELIQLDSDLFAFEMLQRWQYLIKKQAVWLAATICPRPLQVDLWPFDIESGVRVTCDVGYLCANFSLPRPLCSRLRPDVRDR